MIWIFLSFVVGLGLTGIVYEFLIVPFHTWAAGKMGKVYDRRTNT